MSIIIYDTETTGLSHDAEAIQVAYVEIDDNYNVLDEWQTLLKPTVAISPSSTQIHGITPDMVAGAPSIRDPEIRARLSRITHATFVSGHNLKFDKRILKDFADPTTKTLDTLTLSKLLLPKSRHKDLLNHRLQTLVAYTGIPQTKAHEALGDVWACRNLLKFFGENNGVGYADLFRLMNGGIKQREQSFIDANLDAINALQAKL